MLLVNALTSLIPLATGGSGGDGEFHGPTIMEFFPDIVLFEGTPFAMNRIMMIRVLVTLVIVAVFWLGTRNLRLVPTRGQGLIEYGFDFVRVGIAEDLLGKKDGRRFLPILMTFFFLVLASNITGVVPFLNIANTGVIGLPLLLALIAYVTWIYAGLKKHPGTFLKNALFPPGVPPALYIIVTPIEFISTFIVRPVTHTLRLMMNMVVGHLLLVLFFSATHFFFFTVGGGLGLFGVGTLAFGVAFSFFEILVAVLQAYVFTILTAVYLQLALAEDH
ncbi:ATP synthase F0 subcomplex A subunit [Homoserinimonas aerilata]|uniref:ATP synthase subunit a n=1 Tax=Homoserinimonas aerilata TaxID=1162970 RepID=A0A542YKB9_9MICO|nr:ATP synthase F0 subcomplex A subunit [Homoserinimonas aerilata]